MAHLTLKLKLKSKLAEDYVLNNGRSELDYTMGIYIKGCQELHTKSEYALIMIHKS